MKGRIAVRLAVFKVTSWSPWRISATTPSQAERGQRHCHALLLRVVVVAVCVGVGVSVVVTLVVHIGGARFPLV